MPVVLGRGENIFPGLGGAEFEAVEVSGTSVVTQVSYRRSSHLTLT